MTRRVVQVVALVAMLVGAGPASAQGRVPRSPSDRAVDMRGGAPDLALDSRMAASSPTSTSNADTTPWTRHDTGLVLVWIGLPLLVISAVLAGVSTEVASDQRPGVPGGEGDEGAATVLGVTAGATGLLGLGLLIPGLVLTFGDDEPRVTARARPGGASLDVAF